MTMNEKEFKIREFREGTSRVQPAYVDIQIGDVVVKGIEIFLDENENPQIKLPVFQVKTRYGNAEIDIVAISGELKEGIVNELMDNYEDKICPLPKTSCSSHTSDNFIELFKPQING